jgi:UDP-GlcNAc:undecaprenyl-phosphate GlcNAc-1-phosphate transferase
MFLVSLGVALGTALLIVPLLMRGARRIGLVDAPGGRKQHSGAIPLVGGVAIFIAAVVGVAASGQAPAVPAGFVTAAVIILAIGVFDDARELGSVFRFVVEGIAISLAIWSTGHVLPDLGRLLGGDVIQLNTWTTMLTVVGILGVVNAMNLVDGVDGLAGGIAATALFWLIIAYILIEPSGAHASAGYALPVLTAVLGGVVGFLNFNLRRGTRRRASVFLGDAGSLFLGFVIGWFAVGVTATPMGADMPPAAVIWLLWVPLYDTLGVMVRRVLAGRSPMSADREHLHHLFQDLGLSPRETVNRLIALNLAGGAIGIFGWQQGFPEVALFSLFAIGFLLYVATCAWVWRKLKAPLPSARRSARDNRS